jgi:exonuclease VII small subunit
MTAEEFQKLVLDKLSKLEEGQIKLEEGQANIETGLKNLRQGQQEIRRELQYVWDDIKRLDKRLTQQEEETFILKRMK